jgi:hypothetical protein
MFYAPLYLAGAVVLLAIPSSRWLVVVFLVYLFLRRHASQRCLWKKNP